MSFDISGGNDDLYFYILDSGGNRVFDAGTISSGYVLYWEASKNDYFRFVFDNSMSWITTKELSFTLNFYDYTIFLYVLGFANLGIAAILFINACMQYCPKCGVKLESA